MCDCHCWLSTRIHFFLIAIHILYNPQLKGCFYILQACRELRLDTNHKHPDTLAWATGTPVAAGYHAIALFCIGSGRVLGFLYSDTFILHFVVNCAH